MHHHVGVDGIGPGVASHGGADASADAAALPQDVVPLHADGGSTVLEERLAHLCVPYQLVGVHACILVAASALLIDVGAEAGSPGCIDSDVSAIVVAPVVHVGTLLQGRAGMLVVHSTAHTHLQQVVAEVETQVLVDVGSLGGCLLQRCVGEDVVHVHVAVGQVDIVPVAAVAVAAQVSHVVAIVDVGEGVDVEVLLLAHCRVEHKRAA